MKKESNIAIFERILLILQMVNATPVATIHEINRKALPDFTKRSTQRYIKCLEDAGYIKIVGKMPKRLYLTEKARLSIDLAIGFKDHSIGKVNE